ncbi:MAG: hypothetical protein WCG22_06745 [Lentisphaerota bacterium]
MASKAPAKAFASPVESTKEYRMPKDVSEWIEAAGSRITYLTSTVERLKEENAALRKANKVMETRMMGTSQE